MGVMGRNGTKGHGAWIGALCATLLTLTATPALAADPPLLAKFGQNCGDPVKVGNGCGDEAGETNIPLTLATDPATGHLFVQEVGNRRIDEFDAWGTFVRAWGWGVRDGSAELQTCTAQSGCQEGLTGDGPGQFGGEEEAWRSARREPSTSSTQATVACRSSACPRIPTKRSASI